MAVKRLRVMALALMTVLLLAAVLPVPASADYKMKVNTKWLRLRTGPGTDYPTRGWYGKGQVVTVVSSKSTRHWYYVKTSKGQKGWMYKGYLTKYNAPVKAAAEPASGTAVATKNVKMRKGPGTCYDVIRVIKSGKHMRIVGRTGSWYKVKYDGKYGFVYRGLVKKQ